MIKSETRVISLQSCFYIFSVCGSSLCISSGKSKEGTTTSPVRTVGILIFSVKYVAHGHMEDAGIVLFCRSLMPKNGCS